MTDKSPEASNGLLARRAFLSGSAAATVTALGSSTLQANADSKSATQPRLPGGAMRGYGQPASSESEVIRQRIRSQPGTTGSGASATPLQHLQGTITPSGLHFERHHSGVPQRNADTHKLILTGAVKRSLRLDLDALHRYPMVTRNQFLECSGNSAPALSPQPLPWDCADIHGLVSGSEWTGVPLHYLLEDAGIKDSAAAWVIAEGADAARMNRSIPLAKCLDDAMIALYQNGERLRPENGYPMRLFLPGFEGNMSIKWLHRLEVSAEPAMSREETSKYTDLRNDGTARGFSFEMGVKSLITSPSPGLTLGPHGRYQISGLAWTGAGHIRRVEVSADGGATWVDASFTADPESLALTRFQAQWIWNGQPAALVSRATDSAGNTQPTRSAWITTNGQNSFYHYNAMQLWKISSSGEVKNAYAS